jgi:hypothetical protein
MGRAKREGLIILGLIALFGLILAAINVTIAAVLL